VTESSKSARAKFSWIFEDIFAREVMIFQSASGSTLMIFFPTGIVHPIPQRWSIRPEMRHPQECLLHTLAK
jgi:hypothetical protein